MEGSLSALVSIWERPKIRYQKLCDSQASKQQLLFYSFYMINDLSHHKRSL